MCDCIKKETRKLSQLFRNKGKFFINENSLMIPFKFEQDESIAHVQVKYCPFCGEPQKGQKPSWSTAKTVFNSRLKTEEEVENFLFTREFNVLRPDHCDTEPKTAIKMAEYLDIQNGDFILEPGAGNGNLISAVLEQAAIKKKKINVGYCERNGEFLLGLATNFPKAEFVCSDITDNKIIADKIIMNPPFKNMEFLDHVLCCFNLLVPQKGILVAIVPTVAFYIPKFNWINEYLYHKEEINFNCGYGAELSIIILKHKNQKV